MHVNPKFFVATCAAIGATSLLALTACTAASGPAAVETTAATQSGETTATPACSGLTGMEALGKWADDVESDRHWDLTGEYSEIAGYDQCAELSVIVLRPDECCTAFEITPVMFFHRGEFIADATVTDRAVDRFTESERIADDEVALTYTAQESGPQPTLTKVAYAWDDESGVVSATEVPADPVEPSTGVYGRWCPTPESKDEKGCVTVELPTATYDDGTTVQLTDLSDPDGDGGTSFTTPDGPFGTYYPAGIAIVLPDYYAGADLPGQDRIWNAQTGALLVRG